MNLTWHLIKKDFLRLRVPLAMFAVLVAGKIAFYAYIAGLFSAPDIEWLRRMQNGPEMLLRFFAEPVLAYLLVGWLVFEDSPIEQDAHWLTRPISGVQLFVAKLAGAVAMFVLLPLALHVAWWIACGVSTREMLVSGAELAGMHAALVALAMACAALTGGFPRFILWSLVGFVIFGMAQLGYTLVSAPGFGPTRVVVTLFGSGLAALAIAWHQFVMRRHRTSLVLVGVGLLVVFATSAAWRWDIPGMGDDQPAVTALGASTPISATLTGPARYKRMSTRHYVDLPVRIEGVPEKSVIMWLTTRGDWSFAGKNAWTSNIGLSRPSLLREAVRRQIGFAAPAAADGQMLVGLPFSLAMAQQAVREPVALQGSIELQLGRMEILAELPLREGRGGAYTISHLTSGPVPESKRGTVAEPVTEPAQNGVSLLFTERSALGMRANSTMRMVASTIALVNRQTGDFFLNDSVRSGPESITVLNQTKVVSWRLTYLTGQAPVRPEDLSLVMLSVEKAGTVKVDLQSDAVAFAADSVPRSSN